MWPVAGSGVKLQYKLAHVTYTPSNTGACVEQPITGLPHTHPMHLFNNEVGRGMVCKMPPGRDKCPRRPQAEIMTGHVLTYNDYKAKPMKRLPELRFRRIDVSA